MHKGWRMACQAGLTFRNNYRILSGRGCSFLLHFIVMCKNNLTDYFFTLHSQHDAKMEKTNYASRCESRKEREKNRCGLLRADFTPRFVAGAKECGGAHLAGVAYANITPGLSLPDLSFQAQIQRTNAFDQSCIVRGCLFF